MRLPSPHILPFYTLLVSIWISCSDGDGSRTNQPDDPYV